MVVIDPLQFSELLNQFLIGDVFLFSLFDLIVMLEGGAVFTLSFVVEFSLV